MAIQLDGTTGISTTGNIVADGSLVVGSFNPSAINASGNVAGLNLNTNGNLSVGGNTIVAGDLTVVGNASLSGNIVGDKITNGTTSVEIQTPNGNANITIGGTSNIAVFATTGAYITGVISANGNITGGNILGGANVNATTHTGTTVSVSGNITGGNLNAAGLSLSSNVVSALISSSNITTTANISGNYILGNGSLLSGIDAASIQNGTSNVRVVSSGGNVAISIGGTNNIAVFATTGEYITGLLSASGNITGDNLNTGGLISSLGNITGGNLSGTSITGSVVSASGDIRGANLFTNGTISTSANVIARGLVNANANASVNFYNGGTYSANIILYQEGANGNVTVRVGESTLESPGIFGLFATGSIGATQNIISEANIVQFGNSSTWVLAKNVSSAGVVSASGNVIAGNLNAAGLSLSSNIVSALNSTSNITTTANVNAGYFVGTFAGNISGNITAPGLNTQILFNDSGNAAGAAAFTFNKTSNTVSVIGNISSGNVATTTQISAGGNIIAANISTGGLISATGNITGGNVNTNRVTGTALTLISTGDLTLSTTGNINANNEYINNVPQPQQDGDAVNKLYVDNLVTTGFNFHQPVTAATYTTLATATGG